MKAPNVPTELLVLTDEEWAEFEKRVSPVYDAKGCAVWTAGGNSQGYGVFYFTRNGVYRGRYAHRIVAVAKYGTFDPELLVDHKCHNRRCVNPDHLRLVTPKQNGENRSGANARSATGLRGVYWVAKDRRWVGEVRHNNSPYRTRYFHTAEEADVAVRALRLELFTHTQEVAS